MVDVEVQQLWLADLQLPDFHPEAPGTDTVFGFLIRDGSACILVDSGVGTGSDLIDRLYKPERVELQAALAEANATLRDITAVVNTHLHFDHCGNNALFADVPIFVQEAELNAAQQSQYTVPEWVNFAHSNYVAIRGTHSISENLQLVATPGHTPGHQSIIARSGSRTEIVVGQAAYTAAEFQQFCDRRGEDPDPALDRCIEANATWARDSYLASLAVLQRARPDRAYFSHDSATWTRAV